MRLERLGDNEGIGRHEGGAEMSLSVFECKHLRIKHLQQKKTYFDKSFYDRICSL